VGISHVLRRVTKSRHTPGRKFTRAFGPVFFYVAPRQKNFFVRAHFFS
jgi:hypothetical protein